MSISQFKNNLRNYIVKWGDENNQDINNEKSRGSAFEDFVLGVISDRYEYDNTSPLDNINRTNDCGFDIIIPPSGNANFYTVCQCEVGGYGKKTNASIDREKLKGWMELLSNLMDKTWIDDQKQK